MTFCTELQAEACNQQSSSSLLSSSASASASAAAASAESKQNDMIENASVKLWTSTRTLQGGKRTHEFCSILNDAIRSDRIDGMEAVVKLSRGLNSLCVVERREKEKV